MVAIMWGAVQQKMVRPLFEYFEKLAVRLQPSKSPVIAFHSFFDKTKG
ncbi:hypothetical protein BGS_1438 [Beggiatoa sp. SS]|nr:hypothetical protein BGS_1438 [Beggiatoa sp. SS]